MKKEWTLTALNRALQNDLKLCNTQLEIDCCKSLAIKEMRELYHNLVTERKLTPGEISIAQQYGF